MMAMKTLTKLENWIRDVFLEQGKRLSNLKDFTHKIEHFVQGLEYAKYLAIITNSYPSQKAVNFVKKGSS